MSDYLNDSGITNVVAEMKRLGVLHEELSKEIKGLEDERRLTSTSISDHRGKILRAMIERKITSMVVGDVYLKVKPVPMSNNKNLEARPVYVAKV